MLSANLQELIRRWDSERELFYYDITHVHQSTEKENLLRLTNYTIAKQVMHIKFWFYESARNLYRGHHAVPLQTFTTTHGYRKLSIVMALLTTFTQYAPENNAK